MRIELLVLLMLLVSCSTGKIASDVPATDAVLDVSAEPIQQEQTTADQSEEVQQAINYDGTYCLTKLRTLSDERMEKQQQLEKGYEMLSYAKEQKYSKEVQDGILSEMGSLQKEIQDSDSLLKDLRTRCSAVLLE